MGNLEILKAGLTDPYRDIAYGTVNAGANGTSQAFDAWYRRGLTGGSSGAGRLRITVWDAALSRYVASGHPVVDDCHYQGRITGVITTGDGAQAQYVSGWRRMGAGRDLRYPSLFGGCAWVGEVRYAPPINDGAANDANLIQLENVFNDATCAGGDDIAGVETRCGHLEADEFVIAPTVTSVGAVLTVGKHGWLDRGIRRNRVTEDYAFNGTAADGALGSGQEYKSIVSRLLSGGGITVTKGNKASTGAGVAPTMPADSLYVRTVTVPFGVASLTISGAAYSRRCLVEVVSGLDIRICPGRVRLTKSGGLDFDDPIETTLPNNTTRWIWLTSIGGAVLTTTLAPATRGDTLLAKAVTSSGVTTLTDMRTFYEPTVMRITFRQGAELVFSDFSRDTLPFAGALDRIVAVSAGKASTGTGATKFDLRLKHDGTAVTLFTSSGTDDQRPTLAATAHRGGDGGWPEVTTFVEGDRFLADVVATSSGGDAEDVSFTAVVYPIQ